MLLVSIDTVLNTKSKNTHIKPFNLLILLFMIKEDKIITEYPKENCIKVILTKLETHQTEITDII